MELGESLSTTPSWAVATVTAGLIILSLLLEHFIHFLTHVVEKQRRKSLIQAISQMKGELRNLGFISLLMTVAQQPVSKICISRNLANSFLPCGDKPAAVDPGAQDADYCTKKGKVSLVSYDGTQQLQVLIFMLAVSLVASSLLTLRLGEIKIKKWGSWEAETQSLEHQLSNDPRRFKLPKQTSFGRRHLKFWSNHCPLLWIVCFVRLFTGSILRADYYALRTGFIAAHVGKNFSYNFHKFLRRSIDKDFKEAVTMSPAIWTYAIVFIFFNAKVFYNHYWLPFIPLLLLLAIGTKLQVIITKMCLQGSRNAVIVSGDVFVNLNDELFWFGRPRWLLYAIHFVLIQNSFQLSFLFWAWYKFGFHSCFHRETVDFSLSLGLGILGQFLCAYVILPLYALVNQMGSSMRETIFADRMMEGLKNWHSMAKKSLESNGIASSSSQSISRSPSPVMRPIPIPRAGSSWLTLPSPTSSESDSAASLSPLWSPLPLLQSGRASSSKGKELPLSVARSAGSLWMTPQPLPRSSESPAANSSSSSRSPLHSFRRAGGRFSKGKELSLTMPSAESFSSAFRAVSAGEFGLRRSSGLSRLPGSSPSFEFPTGMRELMEIQRVTEEMIGPSSRSSFEGGELSFRAWWKQEIIFPSGWRSPSSSRD